MEGIFAEEVSFLSTGLTRELEVSAAVFFSKGFPGESFLRESCFAVPRLRMEVSSYVFFGGTLILEESGNAFIADVSGLTGLITSIFLEGRNLRSNGLPLF